MREHWRNAAAKNWRRDARVVLGLELRRLAQPRPISLEINRLGLLSQAKGRAVYASTPGAASPNVEPARVLRGPRRPLCQTRAWQPIYMSGPRYPAAMKSPFCLGILVLFFGQAHAATPPVGPGATDAL